MSAGTHLRVTQTCRDTKGQSRGRSRDPDRWPLLWTGTTHTAASPTDRRLRRHYETSGEIGGKERETQQTHKHTQTRNRIERWTVNH